MKLKDLIQKLGLEMRLVKTKRNPYYDSLMHAHFEVTFYRLEKGQERKFVTYYSVSLNRKDEPSIEEVLKALANDCQSVEDNPEYEDWAGQDQDSVRALKAFEACKSNSERLKDFLGLVTYYQVLDTKG